MKSRFGFTLIELVMVIIILGILAAVTLPKFVNFKARAQIASDSAVFGALKTAAELTHLSYLVQGVDAYPADPFAFLEKPPPYANFETVWGYGGTIIPDGVTWYYFDQGYRRVIYCPHCNGNRNGGAKGTAKNYCYLSNFGYIAGEWREDSGYSDNH